MKIKSNYSGTNKRMSTEVYKKRSEVMTYIYEAKNLLGDSFKRITLRITEKPQKGILGEATLGTCIIWIPEDTLTKYSGTDLRHVVLHEIGHAIFKAPHNDNCKLMQAYFGSGFTTVQEQNEALLRLAISC